VLAIALGARDSLTLAGACARLRLAVRGPLRGCAGPRSTIAQSRHVIGTLEGNAAARRGRGWSVGWRARRGPQRHQMSRLCVAARCVESLVLRLGRHAWTVLRELRHGVEYVFNPRTMPRLPASMAVDIVSSLRRMVATCGLVRAV